MLRLTLPAFALILNCVGCTATELKVTDVECVAYWQLKSIAMEQEYSIASANAAAAFQTQYTQEKEKLKITYGEKTLTLLLYDAMKSMMSETDGELKNLTRLDAKYQKGCDFDVQKWAQ